MGTNYKQYDFDIFEDYSSLPVIITTAPIPGIDSIDVIVTTFLVARGRVHHCQSSALISHSWWEQDFFKLWP
jgi:hypothetical protein